MSSEPGSTGLVRLVSQSAWVAETTLCPWAGFGRRMRPSQRSCCCLGHRFPGRGSPAWEGMAAAVPPPRARSREPVISGEETPGPAPVGSPHTQAGECAKT